MKKDFTVHITPKPISDSSIMEPLLEALQTAREENVVGLVIGLVKETDEGESLVCYTNFFDVCDIEDMYDLIEMIKFEIMDRDTEEESDF